MYHAKNNILASKNILTEHSETLFISKQVILAWISRSDHFAFFFVVKNINYCFKYAKLSANKITSSFTIVKLSINMDNDHIYVL